MIHPRNGLPNDFKNHEDNPINQGWGAVDYDEPIGTPLVPTADTLRTRTLYGRTGGNALHLLHGGYISGDAHLDRYGEIIGKGTPRIISGIEFRDQQLDKSKIVAFSGNSGVGPGGVSEPPHLHLEIVKVIDKEAPRPGIDPFEVGIDQKKPVDEYVGSTGRRRVAGDGDYEKAAQAVKDAGKHLENAFFQSYGYSPVLFRTCDRFIELKTIIDSHPDTWRLV